MNDREKLIERIMERICDLCHHPYVVTDQDAMDEICNACPVEAEIRALLKENAHGTAQA